ncbi:hypothetical protein [Micromonospora sp. NPDC049891]|uniref:hypothetical protein n=1 Tax=Micromonospora sp. NPDC049891 TaxID=3155655 RepID=UPI003408FD29
MADRAPIADRIHAVMLRDIAAGRVWHYPAGNGNDHPTDRIDVGGRMMAVRPSHRMAVIEQRGLACHESPTGSARVAWVLTDAGRAVLAGNGIVEAGRG